MRTFNIDEFIYHPKLNLLSREINRHLGEHGDYSSGFVVKGKTRDIEFRRCVKDYDKPLQLMHEVGHHRNVWTYVTKNTDDDPLFYIGLWSGS